MLPTPVRGAGPLRYQEVRPRAGATAIQELLTVKLRHKAPDGDASWLIEQPVRDGGIELARTSDDFRFAAAVAEWGLLLRDSKFKGNSSWADVLGLARGAMADDPGGYRAEFVRLVEQSRQIVARERPDDRGPAEERH